MGNQRTGDTKGGYVYMVVWGEQVIPMMKLPQIGTKALFCNATNRFVEGAIVWSMDGNRFVFLANR